MKVKKGFKLNDVCGVNILVAEGLENIDFSSIISMNETAAFMWHKVEDGHEFTVDELVDKLTEEYDVDKATARKDIEEMVGKWLKAGIIDA